MHHRRQRAATEAGDRLDRENALGVGVVGQVNLEVAQQRLVHRRRAPHMAGRAVAHADAMQPGRAQAKLPVESGDAGDLGFRDAEPLRHALQRHGRQIAVAFLNDQQQRDQPAAIRAGFLDQTIHFRDVNC